eukprot:SM000193S05168  [mRNA]  locus=s193:30962:31994:- [translate_table: standard]
MTLDLPRDLAKVSAAAAEKAAEYGFGAASAAAAAAAASARRPGWDLAQRRRRRARQSRQPGSARPAGGAAGHHAAPGLLQGRVRGEQRLPPHQRARRGRRRGARRNPRGVHGFSRRAEPLGYTEWSRELISLVTALYCMNRRCISSPICIPSDLPLGSPHLAGYSDVAQPRLLG